MLILTKRRSIVLWQIKKIKNIINSQRLNICINFSHNLIGSCWDCFVQVEWLYSIINCRIYSISLWFFIFFIPIPISRDWLLILVFLCLLLFEIRQVLLQSAPFYFLDSLWLIFYIRTIFGKKASIDTYQ